MEIAIIILLCWMFCGLISSYILIIKEEPKESRNSLINTLLMVLITGPLLLISVLKEKN